MTAYFEFALTCGCGENLGGIAGRKTLVRWLKSHEYSHKHLQWEADERLMKLSGRSV